MDEINFIKDLSKKDKKRVGHKENEIQCPKCKSWKVTAFYFSFSPPVLECESCGYTWEAEVSNSFKRVCRKFRRLMQGNLDY